MAECECGGWIWMVMQFSRTCCWTLVAVSNVMTLNPRRVIRLIKLSSHIAPFSLQDRNRNSQQIKSEREFIRRSSWNFSVIHPFIRWGRREISQKVMPSRVNFNPPRRWSFHKYLEAFLSILSLPKALSSINLHKSDTTSRAATITDESKKNSI